MQRKSLPVLLNGSDAVIMARTGSGKTCAFLIPVLEKIIHAAPQEGKQCSAVILSPTRELSLQTLRVMQKISHFTNVRSIGINGGEGMEKQFDALASRPDVIVATPGRLAHHLSEIPDFDLKGCHICVLDEADRLLEMGFAAQIRQISSTMPEHCQKVLLSATMPKILVEFTKSGFISDPEVVRLDQEVNVSPELRMAFITCRSADKEATLLHVLDHVERDRNENSSSRTGLCLIFAATRHHVEYITCLLQSSGVNATMIYGTLDQEARKSNLAAFRSGKKPVMVVTDVAARGIDVPLIDHVVHYSFPPSAKLFIHRSGRAARAGRIGYCWGLVEPDEMPYMVDLHVFLGRPLRCAGVVANTENYALTQMSPEDVHYGAVPEAILVREVDNVRRIMDCELAASNQASHLRALTKVCNNAMKQYRRTRPEASRAGVRRAKAILEGERLPTGERKGGGIPTHPLLARMEFEELDEKDKDGLTASDNYEKRKAFLRQISAYRPKETVFETLCSSGSKQVGIVSQVDRGRTANASESRQHTSLRAMQGMRRQMKMMHYNGAIVVAGSDEAQDSSPSEQPAQQTGEEIPMPVSKKRMSKADRKRLKKGVLFQKGGRASIEKKTKGKCHSDFRDADHFIENDFGSNAADCARSRQMEAAMQPSASSTTKGSIAAALRLEEAMVDMVGDEHADLAQKQRMMRWDKAKRKYIRTTVGSELSGASKSKKMRLESGQLVKSSKMKLGDLYEKWQKKTNQSVGRSGIFDDASESIDGFVDAVGDKGLNVGSQNDAQQKNASQIRKRRETVHKNKVKNMKKADRRRFEQRLSAKKGLAKGSEGRKGVNRRWGSRHV